MNNISIYTEKLRESGLRPTRQRLKICEVLFSPEKTFHFTINDLTKIIEDRLSEKISLATVYNTIHAFKKKGYLKEISINSDKSYFDTNVSEHHHFFDEAVTHACPTPSCAYSTSSCKLIVVVVIANL